MNASELRIPAIEVRQSAGRVLYSFAIDGKLVPSFAAISRVHRRDAHLEGYQRPEVLAHIGEIRDYLESESPMIPNAVVIAFDKRVRFEPAGDTGGMSYARPGTLVIPIDADSDDAAKPGFVVDGQQRLAAIRDAAIGRISDLCFSVHRSRRERSDRAVHPRQLDEAASEGPDLRIASKYGNDASLSSPSKAVSCVSSRSAESR